MDELPININYCREGILRSAAAQFKKDWSIQLHGFLQYAVARRISLSGSLKHHYVPDQYSYHTFKLSSVAKNLEKFIRSADFAAIISAIVGKKVKIKHASWRGYTHGDYTVRHDKLPEPPGYDIVLDFTPRWDPRACGQHSFVQGGQEIIRIPPVFNSLTIVKRPKHVQKFVKYVNHRAGKDKRIVLEARFT